MEGGKAWRTHSMMRDVRAKGERSVVSHELCSTHNGFYDLPAVCQA